MKYITLILFAFVGLFVLPACKTATLDQSGVYKGDTFLYQTDQTIGTVFNFFQTYVSWEYNNRAILSARPEVKQSADYIRTNVKQWRDSSLALRDAYAANPTPDNKVNLQKLLAVLQTALVQASAYIAAPITSTTP
jgi:hypothetical protein